MDAETVIICAELLVLIVFANRYIVGTLLGKLMGKKYDPRRDDYEPTVTIVIPMYNEGETIKDTIISLLDQEYPVEKLDIIVIDDCSTDDSYEWALKGQAVAPHRVSISQNPHNMGKRRGINRAVRQAKGEIIVSVDSDVIVDVNAVRELVARFVSDDIAAVGGRVNILNRNANWLTKMQTIKYFFGYEYLKSTERAFRTVMCLSGCLTAYRKSVLLELEPVLETRAWFGIPIKYGEDRFLTRQIIKAGHKTMLTMDAICYTKAPEKLGAYFSQQLRWRRSNLVDYAGGIGHVWRQHPVVVVHYFSLFALIMAYPVVVLASLFQGSFYANAFLHLGVLAVFGAVYMAHPARQERDQRVPGLYFLAMVLVMPVTYIVLTPLAMFTLDSGSWETRGHTAGQGEKDKKQEALPSLPGRTVDIATPAMARVVVQPPAQPAVQAPVQPVSQPIPAAPKRVRPAPSPRRRRLASLQQ